MQHVAGLTVLFHAPCCGVVVEPDRPEQIAKSKSMGLALHPVGEYRTDWLENNGYWKEVKEATVKL